MQQSYHVPEQNLYLYLIPQLPGGAHHALAYTLINTKEHIWPCDTDLILCTDTGNSLQLFFNKYLKKKKKKRKETGVPVVVQ